MAERTKSSPGIALNVVAAVAGLMVVAIACGFGIDSTVTDAWAVVAVVAGATLLGTAHGASVVAVVFRIADPPRRRTLAAPGSLAEPSRGDDLTPPAGTMRGGAMIGVLERAAIIAAVACGQPSVLAVIVAVKAIGRFSELEGAIMRERFLVGSLASFTVAAGWGLAAWLVVTTL